MSLPESWKVGSLDDFFETSTGATPKKSQKDNYGSDVPFVKPPELLNTEIGNTADNLSLKGAASSRTLPPGSILVSCIGNLGKVGINTETVAFNQQINAIKPNNDYISKFMFYQVLSSNFKEQLEKLASGTTVPIVNKSKFNSIFVVLPPIPEQKRIVALLDTVFANLEETRTKTEQNLKNARELFDSYLQQVFSQKGEGCEKVPLSGITESISDGDHSAPPKSIDGIPFITISNINKKTLEIDFSDTFKVPNEYYSALKWNRKPKTGDVLYTVTGSYGIPVLVKENKEFCFQRHIGLVRPSDNINSRWMYYLLMSPQVFNQADSGATGAAQKTVSLKLLRSILVPNITRGIQDEMVNGLDVIYKKSRDLEVIYTKKLKHIDELKKSILQKAFSGELTTEAE